jgi:hypothetical protein
MGGVCWMVCHQGVTLYVSACRQLRYSPNQMYEAYAAMHSVLTPKRLAHKVPCKLVKPQVESESPPLVTFDRLPSFLRSALLRIAHKLINDLLDGLLIGPQDG